MQELRVDEMTRRILRLYSLVMPQQLILELQPPPAPSLDNFIGGRNTAAVQALHECGPGKAVYLWGPPGVGRSHLLRAIALDRNGLYVDARVSAAALAPIVQDDTIAHALIAIDNVQTLTDSGQAALFALYNRWRESSASTRGFCLVLAGDQAPVVMPVREDLRTRLGWDLVFRLEPLSDEERVQALQNQASARGLDLSQEVIAWVLTHYSRDMSHLSALLDALDRYSIEKHRAITVPLLKDLLAKQSSPDANRSYDRS